MEQVCGVGGGQIERDHETQADGDGGGGPSAAHRWPVRVLAPKKRAAPTWDRPTRSMAARYWVGVMLVHAYGKLPIRQYAVYGNLPYVIIGVAMPAPTRPSNAMKSGHT